MRVPAGKKIRNGSPKKSSLPSELRVLIVEAQVYSLPFARQFFAAIDFCKSFSSYGGAKPHIEQIDQNG
jgi:hypothetical protein